MTETPWLDESAQGHVNNRKAWLGSCRIECHWVVIAPSRDHCPQVSDLHLPLAEHRMIETSRGWAVSQISQSGQYIMD